MTDLERLKADMDTKRAAYHAAARAADDAYNDAATYDAAFDAAAYDAFARYYVAYRAALAAQPKEKNDAD